MARYCGEERNFMAKAASSTGKEPAPGKKITTTKSRARASRSTQAPVDSPTVQSVAPTSDVSEVNALAAIGQRLDTLEEKITASLSGLEKELQTLKAAPTAQSEAAEPPPDATLPLIAELLQRHFTEHLAPITAALKRLEERIGFIANRFKQSGGGGGQERQKPWRQEHGRHPHPRPQRGQPNGQRPNQGQPQQWTPPSAASVQGHFAPRPLPGRGFIEEED